MKRDRVQQGRRVISPEAYRPRDCEAEDCVDIAPVEGCSHVNIYGRTADNKLVSECLRASEQVVEQEPAEPEDEEAEPSRRAKPVPEPAEPSRRAEPEPEPAEPTRAETPAPPEEPAPPREEAPPPKLQVESSTLMVDPIDEEKEPSVPVRVCEDELLMEKHASIRKACNTNLDVEAEDVADCDLLGRISECGAMQHDWRALTSAFEGSFRTLAALYVTGYDDMEAPFGAMTATSMRLDGGLPATSWLWDSCVNDEGRLLGATALYGADVPELLTLASPVHGPNGERPAIEAIREFVACGEMTEGKPDPIGNLLVLTLADMLAKFECADFPGEAAGTQGASDDFVYFDMRDGELPTGSGVRTFAQSVFSASDRFISERFRRSFVSSAREEVGRWLATLPAEASAPLLATKQAPGASCKPPPRVTSIEAPDKFDHASLDSVSHVLSCVGENGEGGCEMRIVSRDEAEAVQKRNRHRKLVSCEKLAAMMRSGDGRAAADRYREDDSGGADVRFVCSPLVLDADGDGKLTSEARYVSFDINADGYTERTGWIDHGDALLVRDLDGSGCIEHGGELFGEATAMRAGGTAEHGFAALAPLDGNRDGYLDLAEADRHALRLWFDNGDGQCSPDELKPLGRADIERLDLSYRTAPRTDGLGNILKLHGAFSRHNGLAGQLVDVFFTVSPL